jgi:hypothetical protein
MKIYNPEALGQLSGFGVPTAGTSGQVLQKVDGTNYNTQWTTAKSVTYPIAELGSVTWVKLGTFYTTQTGKLLSLKITSHVGYNANPLQIQVTDLVFSTSNGVSTQSGSTGAFYGAATACLNTNLGTGDATFGAPSIFRIVQVLATQYEVYAQFGSFAGGFYTADCSASDSWIADGSTVSSAPGGNWISLIPTATNVTGQIVITNQTTAALFESWADVSGASFNLGTPGIYELSYDLNVSNVSQWVGAGVFTSANSYITGSGCLIQASNTGTPYRLTGNIHVTVTSPVTYKLRVKSYAGNQVTITQGEPGGIGVGGSTFRVKKIA